MSGATTKAGARPHRKAFIKRGMQIGIEQLLNLVVVRTRAPNVQPSSLSPE
jgi:hypothetical protein